MAAGDGDVRLGTLGSGSESGSDGSSESPGGAGATAEGSWTAHPEESGLACIVN